MGRFLLQIQLIWKYLHGNQAYFVQQWKVAEQTEVDQSTTVIRKCLRDLSRVTILR